MEWTEPFGEGSTTRVVRGGAFVSGPGNFNASFQSANTATGEFFFVGFRIAMIPEPGTGLLLTGGLLGLAYWRRRNIA